MMKAFLAVLTFSNRAADTAVMEMAPADVALRREAEREYGLS